MYGGYSLSAHERVVIRQAPPLDLHWTVARPPIVFGTVVPLPELHRLAMSSPPDLVTMDPRPVVSGNLAAQFPEAGISQVQNGSLGSGPSPLEALQSGPVSQDFSVGPVPGSFDIGPASSQNTQVSDVLDAQIRPI